MAHRTYTDDEVAHGLAMLQANAGNALRTARQLGISRTTLRGWAGLQHPTNGMAKSVSGERVAEQAVRLADRLDRIAAHLSERIELAVADIPIKTAADLRNVLIGQGITIEKASFARGGPTSRSESLRISLVAPDVLRLASLHVIERVDGVLRVLPATIAGIEPVSGSDPAAD